MRTSGVSCLRRVGVLDLLCHKKQRSVSLNDIMMRYPSEELVDMDGWFHVRVILSGDQRAAN